MNKTIDKKIKDILNRLREAHKNSEQYYARESIQGKPTVPTDIYKMSLAFDTEQKIYLELNLARSEKFPQYYNQEQINNLQKEIEILSFNIRAWEKRQFPCQYKE